MSVVESHQADLLLANEVVGAACHTDADEPFDELLQPCVCLQIHD